jgi:hypothetical protein
LTRRNAAAARQRPNRGSNTKARESQTIMKTNLLAIVAVATALAMGTVHAVEATPDTPASGVKPSKKARADARAKRQADMKAAQKKGELAQSEQDKAAPRKPVTPADKAERATKRAELTKDVKAGKLPVGNEAETAPKK